MFLAIAGSVRHKMIIDRNRSSDKSVFELTPMVSSFNSMNGLYPLAEISPIVTPDSLTIDVSCPYYFNEKYIPAYKESPLKDVFRWDTHEPQLLSYAHYLSAGPDTRLTFFRAQNFFDFQSQDEDDQLVFDTMSINDIGGGLRASLAQKSATPKRGKEITLDQYRARTGRSAFRSSYRKKTAPEPSGEATLNI